MKMIFKDNKSHITFEELQIGELFSFESNIDAENPCVCLKLTDKSMFYLNFNEVGRVPVNLELYSEVKRVKGHLVVEGVEE